jgi:hypothetical protein
MNLLSALAEVRTNSQLGAFDGLDLVTGDTLRHVDEGGLLENRRQELKSC